MAGLQQIMVQVPDVLHQQIKDMAERNECSVTAVVRVILLEYFKTHMEDDEVNDVRAEIMDGRMMQRVFELGGMLNHDDVLIPLV